MTTVHAHGRVTTVTIIRRVHRLPRGSVPKILVTQIVKATEVLAVSEIATKHRVVNIAEGLRVKPKQVSACLVKREGDLVEEGEVIAARRVFLRKRRVMSPLSGQVVRVDNGQMLIQGERTRVEVGSTIPGKVLDVAPEEYVIVETVGAAIQIAWGHGGLVWGTLKVLDDEPSLVTDADRFTIDHRGAVLAIGSPLSEAFLKGAMEIRVKGLIASSMSASLIPLLKKVDFPIGLTQGFGQFPMSERILNLLKTYNGREVAMDMGSSADWRERRPEIIIPLGSQPQFTQDERSTDLKLATGQKVRILQMPYLGEIGTVASLPAGSRRLPSGLWTEGAEVELPSGDKIFVPIANLEHLG